MLKSQWISHDLSMIRPWHICLIHFNLGPHLEEMRHSYGLQSKGSVAYLPGLPTHRTHIQQSACLKREQSKSYNPTNVLNLALHLK